MRKITLSNEGTTTTNKIFGKKIIRNETEEPTECTKLNKYADISVNSSIRLYRNASKDQMSQAASKYLQDSLSEASRSTDVLIIKYKYH